jgi:hypothetical protein
MVELSDDRSTAVFVDANRGYKPILRFQIPKSHRSDWAKLDEVLTKAHRVAMHCYELQHRLSMISGELLSGYELSATEVQQGIGLVNARLSGQSEAPSIPTGRRGKEKSGRL